MSFHSYLPLSLSCHNMSSFSSVLRVHHRQRRHPARARHDTAARGCTRDRRMLRRALASAAERRENERGAEKSEAEHFFSYTHQAHIKACTSGGLNIRRNKRAKKRRGVKTGGCAEQDKVLGALPTILKRVLYERVGTIAYTGEKVRL